MFKGREILHLPIVANNSGQEIARVDDFFWQGTQLTALAATPVNQKEPFLLPIQSVDRWEKERILVSGTPSMEPFDPDNLPEEWRHSSMLLGVSVYSDGGKELGRVGDLCLEGPEVVGLEITDGLIMDLFAGRFVIPWQGQFSPDKPPLIVPDFGHPL